MRWREEMEEDQFKQYIEARARARRRSNPPKPADKVFRPKNPELEVLESYEGDFPDSYWDRWTKKELSDRAVSWVDPVRLREEAEKANIDPGWVGKVCERLANGADTGCRGMGRAPTREKNSSTAAANGRKLADTLQSWIKAGILAGPFKEEELPWTDYTLNPLTVRPKPDNSVRVILDMSAPHLKETKEDPVGPDVPRSVNAGIDKELFPTKMSSTLQVLDSIHRVGVPCEACKVDWASAYKHQAVRLEDRKLQCISFGGRIFVETQATFGCASSPGIYDCLSNMVVEIAIIKSKANRETIQKQLDDVAMFGVAGTGTCERFYQEYRRVCHEVGVKLAPEDDPEKAFPPSSAGIILGIYYNFNNWTWRIPEEKATRLIWLLEEIITKERVRNDLAMSVAGKVTHYRVLVRNGYWERAFLLKLPEGTSKNRMVAVTNNMKIQARWWQVALMAGEEGERIPDVRLSETLGRAVISTDAAGGSGALGVGMGGCVQLAGHNLKWFFCPWPRRIKYNMKNSDGISLGQKLSMLEGAAVLTGLTTAAPSLTGRAATALCDNAGFCYAWVNRGSRDLLTYTITKAVHDVAEGLGVHIVVRKITRCSDQLSEAADALSKCEFKRAFENMGEDREVEPMRIPRAILDWLQDPVETATLGRKILKEIKEKHPSLSVRDWREWEDM